MITPTRGVYKHLNKAGEKPTSAELLLYGIAINLTDQVMYTLNVINEVVALPLSLELEIGNYEGYGVALEGNIPNAIPTHIKTGNVRTLSDIFTHIYYSLPIAESATILSEGNRYASYAVDIAPAAHTFAVRRIVENGVKLLELSDNTGKITKLPASDDVFDERVNLSVKSSSLRTRMNRIFSVTDGTLQSARPIVGTLPDHIQLDDPTLDIIFTAAPYSSAVKTLSFNISLMHHRYGTPILNEAGKGYSPIELVCPIVA